MAQMVKLLTQNKSLDFMPQHSLSFIIYLENAYAASPETCLPSMLLKSKR